MILLLGLMACRTDKTVVVEDTAGEEFCVSFDNAEQELTFDDVNLGESGRLEMQLVVDSENPKETSLIGNASYTFENLDVGGGEQLGQADPLGYISKTLGAGNWHFRIEGSENCFHEFDIVIEAGVRLQKCVPLYCE